MSGAYREAEKREAAGNDSACYLCGTEGVAGGPCPSCGELAIAAVECPRCHAANSPVAGVCHGCAATLHDPGAELAFPCPACKTAGRESSGALPFRPMSHDEHVVLHGCPTCQGVFVGARAWAALAMDGGPLTLPPHRPGDQTLHEIGSLVCPRCPRPLEDAVFAGYASGIAIDYCRAHGAWFDRGELGKALDWLAAQRRGERPVPMQIAAPDIDRWAADTRATGNIPVHVSSKRGAGAGAGALFFIGFMVFTALSSAVGRSCSGPRAAQPGVQGGQR